MIPAPFLPSERVTHPRHRPGAAARGLMLIGPALIVASTATVLPAGAADVFVTVSFPNFDPNIVNINIGDRVVWQWVGEDHSATSGSCSGGCTADGLFNSTRKTSGSFSHTFMSAGSFPYFCIPHPSFMRAVVNVAPPPPLSCTAVADPNSGNPPLLVQLTGTGAGGAPPYDFSWDFDDGSPVSMTQNPQHTYSSLGTFTPVLTVTDADANTATCMTDVIATDLTCSAIVDPNSGESPLDVTVTGSASGGNPAYTFSWNFGDGGIATGSPAQHQYTSASVFPITLTARDALNVPCVAQTSVAVALPGCGAGDLDGDGVCDDIDLCPGLYNPGQEDGDADATGDGCDNCAAVYNPAQDDLDSDGEGDDCDLTIIDPLEGASFTDCAAPPTIEWLPGSFDRFRVILGWDPSLVSGTRVTSGDRLLKTTSYPVTLKKWRKACTNARAAGNEAFLQIFGKSSATKQTDTSEIITIQIP